MRFLRQFQIDSLSFWLGFLAASLFWWLISRLRPAMGRAWQAIKRRVRAARGELLAGTEVHLGNDTRRHAQGLHLAAPFFSLDEILIPPLLLAPPVPVDPGVIPPQEDITGEALPFLPDWPELAAVYRARTLTLPQALQGGGNLVITGLPGSGKTVALAHLAIMVLEHAPECETLAQHVPLLVHAANLLLPPRDPESLLATLQDAMGGNTSSLTQARLPRFLQAVFEEGRVLLLLDGLDEVPPAAHAEIVAYLGSLLAQFPGTRVVAAAAPDQIDGLPGLGFLPLPMAAWNEDQRAALIERWGSLWDRFIAPTAPEDIRQIDPAMLNAWLLNDPVALSPLELSLKVWAAYAGDLLGPSAMDAIEAYVRRMSAGVPKALPALQRLAAQMATHDQPFAARKDAESWIAENELAEPADTRAPGSASQEPITTSRVFSGLLESGLLVSYVGSRLAFAHPVIAGYLAGKALASQDLGDDLLKHAGWSGRALALHYLLAHDGDSLSLDEFLAGQMDTPLLKNLLSAGRWLRDVADDCPWRSPVLRQMAACLQQERLPFDLRARALCALAGAGGPGASVLLSQSLASPHAGLRQLAALGSGMIRDPGAVKGLTALLADQSPNVRRAACLALVAIGDRPALEAIAAALLHGDEDLRRAAAEALANHAEEGYPTLQDGSTVEDLRVRRAVVAGLTRVRQPWAVSILEKMQVEDGQWVVQNAALQALEMINAPDPHIPRPLPALTETPWLIAFAGKKGIGVVSGRPAYDLVLLALKEGEDEERLAAMHYLSLFGEESAILPLYQVYYTCEGDLREAAFRALWLLGAAGMSLPPPAQFGFK